MNRLLLPREIKFEKQELLLKDIVEYLKIDASKKHLSEKEYLNVLDIYSDKSKNKKDYIYSQMNIYRKTIRKFPNSENWNNAPSEEKIMKHNCGNKVLYFYTMLFSKRINADWNIFNSYYKNPTVLNIEEKELIISAAKTLNYADITYKNIIYFIEKMMMCTHKKLNYINENDIYEYRGLNAKPWFAKSTFQILKIIGNIDEQTQYESVTENIVNVYAFELKNKHENIVRVYAEFKEYIKNRFQSSREDKKKSSAKLFIGWLWDEYKEITHFKMLSYKHLEKYSEWLKNYISPKTKMKYSKKTVVGHLSTLKSFIGFLESRNYLSDDIINELVRYNDLYYENYKTDIFPQPVPIEDRKKIEELIYNLKYDSYPMVKKMLKIMYLLGLRPSELLSLTVDCIKGTKEAPILHVHKAKRDKERYVPLIPEAYRITKGLCEKNKKSPPIYFEYDGLNCRRLFNYRGDLINPDSLNDIFKKLLIQNNIVTPNNKAKYTLYVLRKIRITTWLEAGMSEDEVAFLVGHGDVNSHNFYLVGEEIRIKNAKKVYETYYKNYFKEIKQTGSIPSENKKLGQDTDEVYLEKLQKLLLEIENKTINGAALKSIVNDFPEYVIPVSCGKCFAVAILGEDFECERMKFPCLECKDLTDAENHIDNFDNYVRELYEANKIYKKNNMNGLIERNKELLERLKKFYSIKFNMDKREVELRFEKLYKETVPKRGRPKKKVVGK